MMRLGVSSLLLLLLVSLSCQAHYTPQDDVSWAITHADTLADPYHQALYDDFMRKCNDAASYCQGGEDYRIFMNNEQPACVHNYTKMGFEKIKCPQKLWDMLFRYWQKNKNEQITEWKSINSYHNMWDAPPHFVELQNKSLGGGRYLQKKVWEMARPVLEEWTGQRLKPVSMYGIRVYHNNSILAPHVDRMPLVTSCIINIDQDVDEPWPLEVFGHDGVGLNVTMEPGDMILYESHSVIHGRPFPFKGRAFVNVFLHFEPIGPLDDIAKCGPNENGAPPYIVAGSAWEKEWFKENPDGWETFDNPSHMITDGDIRGLEYMAHIYPELVNKKDYNGWAPIHEAAYAGHLDVLQLLLEKGASLYDRTTSGHSVMGLALESRVGKSNEVTKFLKQKQKGVEL